MACFWAVPFSQAPLDPQIVSSGHFPDASLCGEPTHVPSVGLLSYGGLAPASIRKRRGKDDISCMHSRRAATSNPFILCTAVK